MEKLEFPQYADDAVRLLMWTPQEIIPMATAFVFGIASDQMLICLSLGLAFSWMYSRYSAGKPEGYVLHWLYWKGVVPLKGRSFINPFVRRIPSK